MTRYMSSSFLNHYSRESEQSHEQDDDDFSDIDVDEMDEDEESGDEIDIRGLVGKGPPAKKQRKD